jgi:hypothetical protein
MYIPKHFPWPRIEKMIKDTAFLVFIAAIGFIACYEIYIFIVRNIRLLLN